MFKKLGELVSSIVIIVTFDINHNQYTIYIVRVRM